MPRGSSCCGHALCLPVGGPRTFECGVSRPVAPTTAGGRALSRSSFGDDGGDGGGGSMSVIIVAGVGVGGGFCDSGGVRCEAPAASCDPPSKPTQHNPLVVRRDELSPCGITPVGTFSLSLSLARADST